MPLSSRLIALAIALALVPAASAVAASPKPPPVTNPSSQGRKLATHYIELVKQKDVAGLKRFLSPAFQIERADGSGADKAEYLKNLPEIKSYKISGVKGTYRSGVLVARYSLAADQIINGKPFKKGAAPRITTFVWDSGSWQVVSHANFNTPQQ